MKYLPTVIFLIFVGIQINAQEENLKKMVVLYNSEPLRVSVNAGGEIYDIHGKAEGYLSGFEVVKSDMQRSASSDESDFAKVEGYYVVSPEVEILGYRQGLATLSRPTIDALDNLISKVFVNPKTKIMLTPYKVNEKNLQQVYLLQNRMNSALAYLALRGISKNQIVISEEPSDNTKEEILGTTLIL
jgi:hypothetical protein